MADHTPDSIFDWMRSRCGLLVNPALSLGLEEQPKFLVVNDRGEPIGAAENIRSGTAVIERYVQQQIRVAGQPVDFLEPIDD